MNEFLGIQDRKHIHHRQNDNVRVRVAKIAILLVPFSLLDPIATKLVLAPIEYVVIFLLMILPLSILMKPRFSFYGHWSIWLFIISAFLTTLSLINLLRERFDIEPIKAWGGRSAFRFSLVLLIILALSIKRDHINLLIKLMVITNIAALVIATFLIIISKDISCIRNEFSTLPSSFVEVLNLTVFYKPNVFARFIIVTFPFVFVWLKNRNSKYLGLIFILNILGMISSAALMGTIAISLEIIILLFFVKKSPKKSLLLLACILVSFPFLYMGVSTRVEKKIEKYREYENTLRLEMFRSAIEAIKSRPLLGYGPGNAKYVINRQGEISRLEKKLYKRTHELTLHNSTLTIATEDGIPAALFFVFGMLFLIITVWSKVRKATYIKLKSLYLACFLSVLSFFMAGMTTSNFRDNIGWYAVAITAYILKAPPQRLNQY